MLEQLLNEINLGGVLSVDALAQKFDTTPAMVRTMLEHLVRQNLIRPFTACASSCMDCAISDDCVSRSHDSGYMLYTLNNGDR